jgi:cytidine deaminase
MNQLEQVLKERDAAIATIGVCRDIINSDNSDKTKIALMAEYLNQETMNDLIKEYTEDRP